MTTTNCAPTAELIPVLRRPRLAKKIPVVASITHNDDEQKLIEKWRGTTPHGREIIRKKLWELKRQLLGTPKDFDEHWAKIESMLPEGLFSRALSAQDEDILEAISEHLTLTQQWAAYRASVGRCARVFPLVRSRYYTGHEAALEFFGKIAADGGQALGSATSSASGKSIFAKQSQFSGHGNPAAAAGLERLPSSVCGTY